jgi:hypothetical protein
VASLFQPEVSHYEIAPWPERIFNGRYPRSASRENRKSIPPAYATELQTVMNTLNDLDQKQIEWDCGTRGVGVLASDSLMFERGDPTPSDPHLSQMYGLAMPLLKRGLPVTPVQLENVTAPDYLQGFKVLLLTYQGMKPLDPEYHNALAKWVKQGGVLVVCDDDSDPYNRVRDWWNSGTNHYATPREHLFERLDFKSAASDSATPTEWKCGRGKVIWARENPARLAASVEGDETVVRLVKQAAADAKLKWRETNYLLLRRGPYVIAAGLDESVAGEPKVLSGHFVNLFDSELRMQTNIQIEPGKRYFLRDLDAAKGRQPQILASAARALVTQQAHDQISFAVEGVANTPGLVLLRSPQVPKSITQGGQAVQNFEYSPAEKLLRIRFTNQAQPVKFAVSF